MNINVIIQYIITVLDTVDEFIICLIIFQNTDVSGVVRDFPASGS